MLHSYNRNSHFFTLNYFCDTNPLTPQSLLTRRGVFMIICIVIMVLSPMIGFAQVSDSQTTLRGIILEKSTGQSLTGANVALESPDGDLLYGTTTDNNGFYQLNNISEESLVLIVSYVGFKTFREAINFSGNSTIVKKDIRLESNDEELDELFIYGAQSVDRSAGQILINSDDMARAPTPSGTADLVNFIQTQPGVVATGDRGGQLFVRGGTPSENLVLMDGTLIYQPFHIIGFFSVFPEQLIAQTNFYAGGFGARYSGRSSSVLDVKLKNGNLFQSNWSASVSPFLASGFAEIPLSEGKSSLVVSARKSLIDEYSSQLLADRQPLNFNSQYAKYSNINENGLKFSTFFLRTNDEGKLDFENNEYFEWGNVVAGMQVLGASESSAISQVEVNFGITSFYNETGFRGTSSRYSDVFKMNIDLNFAQYLGSWRIDYGTSVSYNQTSYNLGSQFSNLNEDGVTFISSRAFMSLEMPFNDYFAGSAGLSATSFLGKTNGNFEPRVELSYKPRGNIDEEFHIAAGIYEQSLVGITDFRDAGTAFTAWMLPPEKDRTMQSKHLLAGWRQALNNWLSFNAEAYFKEISDIPVSTWSPAATPSTEIAYAEGSVKGLDLRIDADWKNYYLSLGYGYSNTLYETAQDDFGTWFGESVQTYHPSHDRRHQLTVQTGFEYEDLSGNISWTYGTGFPYTRPLGFDTYFQFSENLPEVEQEYGNSRILLDKPFNGRLPHYHRLDVSLAYTHKHSFGTSRYQVGAINSYNQSNFFYYDVFTQKGIKQLPFIPYVTVKLSS